MSLIPGQVIKCPLFIAFWKVTKDGLKAHFCKYSANSYLVLSRQTITLLLVVFCRIIISQRPSVQLRVPVNTNFPCLYTHSLNFENTAIQSSLHNWPIESSEELVSPAKTLPVFAMVDKKLFNGKMTVSSVSLTDPSGKPTLGPFIVFLRSYMIWISSGFT